MNNNGGASKAGANFDTQVRRKLGEAIRSRYELAGPLPDRLYGLVQEVERRIAQFRERKGLKNK
jgi:hypothetical protein